jgi:hypothetical protein
MMVMSQNLMGPILKVNIFLMKDLKVKYLDMS